MNFALSVILESPDLGNLIVSQMHMFQESSLVSLVVRRLLLNYIMRPHVPLNSTPYSLFSEGSQPGVLQRVSSAAGMFACLFKLSSFTAQKLILLILRMKKVLDKMVLLF